MKEFNLSDKEWESTDHGVGEEVIAYWKSDVKEFIKRESALLWKLYRKKIDFGKFWIERSELAGDKLI